MTAVNVIAILLTVLCLLCFLDDVRRMFHSRQLVNRRLDKAEEFPLEASYIQILATHVGNNGRFRHYQALSLMLMAAILLGRLAGIEWARLGILIGCLLVIIGLGISEYVVWYRVLRPLKMKLDEIDLID